MNLRQLPGTHEPRTGQGGASLERRKNQERAEDRVFNPSDGQREVNYSPGQVWMPQGGLRLTSAGKPVSAAI